MNIRIVKDWEERVSGFLRDAIAQPHMEPEVCEELCEYIMFLIRQDRSRFTENILDKLEE